MEAKAKHSFIPKESGELAFEQGDTLLILNYGDPIGWYRAQKGGSEGLVPSNYIELKKADWYVGRVTRAQAEEMLSEGTQEGAFVVRLSETQPTDFSLSVRCSNRVEHFRILKSAHNKYFLWKETFDSINELVEYYKKVTVSRNSSIFLHERDRDEVFMVVALYDFEPEGNEGEIETEMGFKKGELISVFESTDKHWWGGRIGNRSGFFPRTYVERVNPVKE